MVIENCKKIEPVAVKLCSKTKYTTFFLNTVYIVFSTCVEQTTN